jgi:hypothetical protein
MPYPRYPCSVSLSPSTSHRVTEGTIRAIVASRRHLTNKLTHVVIRSSSGNHSKWIGLLQWEYWLRSSTESGPRRGGPSNRELAFTSTHPRNPTHSSYSTEPSASTLQHRVKLTLSTLLLTDSCTREPFSSFDCGWFGARTHPQG